MVRIIRGLDVILAEPQLEHLCIEIAYREYKQIAFDPSNRRKSKKVVDQLSPSL
jgi:hypothetical protein